MSQFQKDVISFLRLQYGKALAEADATEIYHSVSAAAMCQARKNWGQLEEGEKGVLFFRGVSGQAQPGFRQPGTNWAGGSNRRAAAGKQVDASVLEKSDDALETAAWASGGLLFWFRRNPRHCHEQL